MTHYIRIVLFSIILTSLGCVNQPLTYDQLGKFSAYPLNKNMYRISYVANDNINYSEAQNIILIKASQTTLQNGYQYFVIYNNPTSVYQKPQTTVTYSQNYWDEGWNGNAWGWGGDPLWSNYYSEPEIMTTTPAEIAYTIECFKNANKAPKNALNASLILQTLGIQYGVAPTGQILPRP